MVHGDAHQMPFPMATFEVDQPFQMMTTVNFNIYDSERLDRTFDAIFDRVTISFRLLRMKKTLHI